jgi:hypothetical protein
LGAGLAAVAGRWSGQRGEVALVVAITLASPTLWANAFSQLLAILPLVRTPAGDRGVVGGLGSG